MFLVRRDDLAAALLFAAMLLATRVEQPQFGEPSEKTIEPIETIPADEIGSASVAPIIDSPKKSLERSRCLRD